MTNCAFIGLAIWLLWMNFDFAGQNLKRAVHPERGASAVAIVGCLLWLLLSMLWLSYVDRRFSADQQLSLQGNVTYDMFVGLTVLAGLAWGALVYRWVGSENPTT